MTSSDFFSLPAKSSRHALSGGSVDSNNFMRRNSLRGSAFPVLGPMCFSVMLAAFLIPSAGRASGDTEHIRWKPVAVAQVKLDDKTPLAFNVYQPEKKKDSHFVLVLLGRRYIELDIKAKLAYSVPLTDLQKNGNDLESVNFAVPTLLLSTSDWTVRDVGPAEQIKLTLGDYGRLLQVDLPHPPDMRAFY
jgi:hypothetical protein